MIDVLVIVWSAIVAAAGCCIITLAPLTLIALFGIWYAIRNAKYPRRDPCDD